MKKMRAALLFAAVMCVLAYKCKWSAEAEEITEYETVRAQAVIDFSGSSSDTIRPLHGINNGPVVGYRMGRFWHDGTRFFQQAGIPYVRTHDVEYPYGKDLFIDIHCIFPDFSADPSLPESYHFKESDQYIESVIKSGSQVFFRLGESIDRSGQHLYIDPPADYGKWAQICEGIINHYNNGFADGYHYNIVYWEIWNEPEGGGNWNGTPEQFYELYKVSASYLKEKFPQLKIGGCATTVSNREFLTGFLEYISEGERAPLDFFSWHVYTASPSWFGETSRIVSDILRQYGYDNTELVLDEWNYNAGVWEMEPLRQQYRQVITAPRGAAFMAASLIAMQNSGVDLAMYYDAQFFDIWNGLFTTGVVGTLHALPGLNSFSYFNRLYQARTQVPVSTESAGDSLYLCAAADQTTGCVMAANYGIDTRQAVEVTFRLAGRQYSSVTVSQTDSANQNGKEVTIDISSDQFTWTLPPDSAALFVFE